MELEIDREMALDNGEELSSDEEQIYEPEVQQQKVAADFKSLDEMVSFSACHIKNSLSFNQCFLCPSVTKSCTAPRTPWGSLCVYI